MLRATERRRRGSSPYAERRRAPFRDDAMPQFFESRKLRYEIHKQWEKRWEIAEIINDGRERNRPFTRSDFEAVERQVLAAANALLNSGEVDAVRVLRERERDDGFLTTSEIFFREASGGRPEPPVTVSRYDGAVLPCVMPNDLYARPACKVIGALLRSYLDKHCLTALELLHFHPYIRKLNDSYSLVQGAIHQAATAQAKIGGTVKERAAALHALIAAAESKARDAMAEKRLPVIEEGAIAAFVERIAARYPEADRQFYMAVALARHFQGSQSLLAKLDFALEALAGEPPREMAQLLDELAAGCLDSSQLVMDLLGHQSNLAEALTSLAELAAGQGETTSGAAATAKLRSLIAAGRLPVVAEGLWDRIVREFSRGRPLSRAGEKREWDLLLQTADRLEAACPGEYKAAIGEAAKLRIRRIRDAALLNG